MDFLRKYYVPGTPGGGGNTGPVGPNDDNIDKAEALNAAFVQMRDTIRTVGLLLKMDINQTLEESDDITKKLGKSIANELVGELKEAGKLTRELNNATKGVGRSLGDSLSLELKIADIEHQRHNIQSLMDELLLHQGQLTKEQLKYQAEINEQLNIQKEILEKIQEETRKTEKSIKGYVGILKSFSKIPLVGGFLGSLINADKVMDSMNKKAKKLGAEANTMKGRWKILGEGLKQTFMNITNPLAIGGMLLGGLLGILQKVFMFAINLNKKFFETAKILGTSVGEATRLYGKFQSMAPLGMSAKQVAESYAAASDSLGFMASTGGDFAITMAGLQKNIGASAEHMTALATQSALSGKSITGSFISMIGSAKAAGAQNKLALTTRQILDKIAKVSSTVLINFKGNIPALATAVVKATKLGTSLEQVNKQAEALLDFENSIQAQFEAEALTGEQLNLDRARGLALMGDTAGVMKELNAQGMTMEKFGSMNVIQRDAFAKAIGLSNEELSKQLIMQKQAEQLGAKEGESLQKRYETLRKQGVTHEQIVARIGAAEAGSLRQQSLADKWQQILERIQDTLGRIVMGPVTEIVNKVIAFLNNSKAVEAVGMKIKKVFQFIADILGNLPQYLQKAVGISTMLAKIAIVRAVASIAAAGASIGGIGGALAAGAVGTYFGMQLYDQLSGAMSSITSGMGTGPQVGGLGGGGGVQPMNQSAAVASAYNSNNNNNDKVHKSQTVVNLNADGKQLQQVVAYSEFKQGYGPGSSWDGNSNQMVGVGAKTG